MTALEAVAGTLTEPARIILYPPAHGALWCVEVTTQPRQAALVTALAAYGARFGQLTWPDMLGALIVVFVAMPAPEALRRICTEHGQIRDWRAALDIDPDSVWEEYQP